MKACLPEKLDFLHFAIVRVEAVVHHMIIVFGASFRLLALVSGFVTDDENVSATAVVCRILKSTFFNLWFIDFCFKFNQFQKKLSSKVF